MTNQVPVLYIKNDVMLPNNKLWQNRFPVESETSGNQYIVAQNINKKHWACSCRGWIRHRNCKHLKAIGLPGSEQPYQPEIKFS